MAATLNAATFMGKNFIDNENSIKNPTVLALRKIIDISEKFVSEREENVIFHQIYWANHSWKQLSMIGDETVFNLQCNILWFGDCLRSWQWNQQYSWERIDNKFRHSIANTTDLTHTRTRWDPGFGDDWKYLSFIGYERIINLQRTTVYVFSVHVLCLGKIYQNPESNKVWEEILGLITSSQSYRNFDGIDGESTE